MIDNAGETPYEYAKNNNAPGEFIYIYIYIYLWKIRILLSGGADPTLIDNAGETPYEYAKNNNAPGEYYIYIYIL